MAIGPFPWKQLNHGVAVNQPSVDWVNAVSRALWTLDIMFSSSTDEASIQRPNADGSFWKIVLPRSWANFKGVDNLSLDYNGVGDDGQMQIYGWDTAADTGALQSTSLFPIQADPGGARALAYANAAAVGAWLIAYGGVSGVTTWNALTDTTGDPTNVANLGFMPVVTQHGSGPYSYSLDLTDLSATGVGPFWVKGATAADCYGEEIGNDSQVKVIDLDTQTLTNGTWLVDAAVVAASAAGALKLTNGGLYAAAGGFFLKGGASQAGWFEAGAHTLAICSGGPVLSSTDGTQSMQLCTGTYAAEAVVGGINANATSGFSVGGVPGANQYSTPLSILDTDGVPHTLYLRGGALCGA